MRGKVAQLPVGEPRIGGVHRTLAWRRFTVLILKKSLVKFLKNHADLPVGEVGGVARTSSELSVSLDAGIGVVADLLVTPLCCDDGVSQGRVLGEHERLVLAVTGKVLRVRTPYRVSAGEVEGNLTLTDLHGLASRRDVDHFTLKVIEIRRFIVLAVHPLQMTVEVVIGELHSQDNSTGLIVHDELDRTMLERRIANDHLVPVSPRLVQFLNFCLFHFSGLLLDRSWLLHPVVDGGRTNK